LTEGDENRTVPKRAAKSLCSRENEGSGGQAKAAAKGVERNGRDG
jgi:hypothetical protein